MIKVFFLIIFVLSSNVYARKMVDANRFELLSGVRRNKDSKSFWDKKFSNRKYLYGKTPAKFLAQNYEYIPAGGIVLDMGMGEGRNAVFLARKGYKILGIDISSVAVKKARRLAREFGVRIDSVIASLDKYKIPKASFDAIICFYYVDRKLTNRMLTWLKPGGIIIYESNTILQRTRKSGGNKYDPRFLLGEGELLEMFPNTRLLKYEEPLHKENFTASAILRKI